MFLFWKRHGVEKRDLLIPASILIGSILISVTICWSAKKIINPLGLANNPTVAGNQAGTLPNETNVKVTSRNGAPRIGAGKLEIVEFSDFQCPFCQKFYNEAYKEIKAKYIDTGKATLVYRHFPLSFHQNAQKAAEASECANLQGKFGPYHDALFVNGKSDGTGLSVSDLKKYAANLGLDTTKFNSCLDSGQTVEVVQADFAEGQKIGVSGTPTFIIGGEKVVGAVPFSVFQNIIEKALK